MILYLTTCLENFTKYQKSLDLLLGSQMCVYDLSEIGYNPLVKQKLYKKIFVKALPPTTHKNPSTCSHLYLQRMVGM